MTLCFKEGFDLLNDTRICPKERSALKIFYETAKGNEWTESTNWMDEFTSPCAWFGVSCDQTQSIVVKLELSNNGLSGKLSKRIGDLSSLLVLDLGDNDMQVCLVLSSVSAQFG